MSSGQRVEFLKEKCKGNKINPGKVRTIDALNMEVEFRNLSILGQVSSKERGMTLAQSLGKRFQVWNLIGQLSQLLMKTKLLGTDNPLIIRLSGDLKRALGDVEADTPVTGAQRSEEWRADLHPE
jgi:hypothetical protein